MNFAFSSDKTYRTEEYQVGKIKDSFGFVEIKTGNPFHGEAIKVYYMTMENSDVENSPSNSYSVGDFDNGKMVGIHLFYWKDEPYKVELYNKGLLVSEVNLLDKHYSSDAENNYVIVNNFGKVNLIGYRKKMFNPSPLLQEIYYNKKEERIILKIKDTFLIYCALSEKKLQEWKWSDSHEEYYYKNIKGQHSCK